jgi:hypothetical protein
MISAHPWTKIYGNARLNELYRWFFTVIDSVESGANAVNYSGLYLKNSTSKEIITDRPPHYGKKWTDVNSLFFYYENPSFTKIRTSGK